MDLPKELHSERSLEAEEINSPLSPVKNELIQRPSSSNLGSTVENQTRDAEKVIVRFRAVGNAPIMKRNHYNIKTTFKFRALTNFLRKELGYKSSESLVRSFQVNFYKFTFQLKPCYSFFMLIQALLHLQMNQSPTYSK
ncbi:Ubiquitin-like protein, variant 2 [Entomophthora muscae]|uniref:Ubiquitin-like protein, variant 2 n=1 Tax=Entomophthora muscae TaxID=34485 RepID=A0ACC2U3G8_9FUNG|nr:Ubiquitin-like protein, variant 2 [Entomophthora muscae]